MYSQTWAVKHIRLEKAHINAVNVGQDINEIFSSTTKETTTHENPTSSVSTDMEGQVEI
jgi:hypothetical protein